MGATCLHRISRRSSWWRALRAELDTLVDDASETDEGQERGQGSFTRSRVLTMLVGLIVSVIFGWLAVRNVSLHGLRRSLSNASWIWLVPALGALLLSLVLRAIRWRVLFPANARPSVGDSFWTINIGYLFNNVLPARAGEVVRAVVVARRTGLSRTQCLTTIVVERVFDLVTLALIMLVARILLPLPHTSLTFNLTIASIVILGFAGLAAVALWLGPVRNVLLTALARVPASRHQRVAALASSVRLGLLAMRNPAVTLPALGWSVAVWTVHTLSYWFVLRAIVPHAHWHAAVVCLVATNLAQVIPSTAGAIGVFEAAAKASLTAYGISATSALSFALVLHAVNLLPFLALGAAGILHLGLRGRELRAPASTAGPSATVTPG